VPSKSYDATPFVYLASYMNIGDDTGSGKSNFKAQAERAARLVQAIDMLRPGECAFIVIDELFTGTGHEKASAAAYTVAEHMSAVANVCFILATHYTSELSKLEQETSGVCKNYKIDAYQDQSGTIIRPYKLERGISDSNIASAILSTELKGLQFNGREDLAVA
jgi:DNA mismatch repair ATPase MutS